MSTKKQKEINLIARDKFSSSFFGRILSWLLMTFRILVMFTEMVVMGAFISRFYLDARNSDLLDEINQKKALLEAQSSFEQDFRDVQKRLESISTIENMSHPKDKYLTAITDSLPSGLIVSSILFTEESVVVKGSVDDERTISQFIAGVKESQVFKNLQLTELKTDSQTEGKIEFAVGGQLL